MRVAVLFSGGKDSTLTAFIMSQLSYDVELVSFIPENRESYMLHSSCLEIVELQADAMGLPLSRFPVSGEKEKEVEEMLEHLSSMEIDGIASGAIASEYQKQRIDYIANSLGIPSYSPLWHKNLINDYERMQIIFSSVSSLGLEEEHLGKSALPYLSSYNFFEGGEAETLVLDAPFFSKRIEVEYEKNFDKIRGELIIRKAVLVDK